MIILEKEQLDNYRYMVAKSVFLISTRNFELIENIPESNVMFVFDRQRETQICISLLAKPTIKLPKEQTIHVYYQTAKYLKKEKSRIRDTEKDEQYRFHLLDPSFNSLFKDHLRMAFMDTDQFLVMMSNYPWRKKIVESLLKESLSKTKTLYKYYAQDTVVNNNHDVNDGKLSFVHPKYFNDPFDCNCVFANNKDMSSLFRVLCMTPMHKNILMWSYYAQDHKGYCFEFDYDDIVREIRQLKINGICIIGTVDYNKKRPPQKSKINTFSYTDLKFYIKATFTKYEEWKHEREYRFLLISKDYSFGESFQANEFITMDIPIKKIFRGVNGSPAPIYDSHRRSLSCTALKKDSSDYLLK